MERDATELVVKKDEEKVKAGETSSLLSHL
jgi:hypothetical protein